MKARAGVRAALSSGANPMVKNALKVMKSSKLSSVKTKVSEDLRREIESKDSPNIAKLVKQFGGVMKLTPSEE